MRSERMNRRPRLPRECVFYSRPIKISGHTDKPMIDLYSAATMNGRRAAIALAECALAHRIHLLDLDKGEQRRPDFLALNPSGAIPVLVDDDGLSGKPITVTQSGAIVLYCAERSGLCVPADPARLWPQSPPPTPVAPQRRSRR